MSIEDNPIIRKRMEQLGIKSLEDLTHCLNNLHIPGEEPFTCPDCGKKLKVNEAEVIKIQTDSKHVSTKFHGRMIERTYRDTYYNVRFCKSCAKKRRTLSKFGIIIIFIVIPLAVGIWSLFQQGRGVGAFFGSVLGTEFSCLVAYGLWNWMTMGSSIDIQHAAKYNALAPNDLFSI